MEDGVPYAIDFLNPAPDADYQSVGAGEFPVDRGSRWPNSPWKKR